MFKLSLGFMLNLGQCVCYFFCNKNNSKFMTLIFHCVVNFILMWVLCAAIVIIVPLSLCWVTVDTNKVQLLQGHLFTMYNIRNNNINGSVVSPH